MSATIVHLTGEPGSTIHPAASHASIAIGTRLRRKLSEHLPSREPGDRVRAGAPREDEREQLPVAACPSLLPLRGGQVARRILVENLDVRHEPGTSDRSLDEIVAQQCVLREAAGRRALERRDVVDALPGVGALAEEVLIDIGHGRGVWIDARVSRRKSPRSASGSHSRA